MSIASVQDAQHGSVRLLGDGSVEFVPEANFSGEASFAYTVVDADGAESTATVQVSVAGVADAATIVAGDSAGLEDQAIPLTIAADFVDADGSESMTIVVRGVPQGGFRAG